VPGANDLGRILNRIDGRGYKAYREIRGEFELSSGSLFIDHVQGDPYAAPSKLRLRVPQTSAALPAELFDNPVRRLALEDLLARRVRDSIGSRGGDRGGSGRNAPIAVDAGAQEVLQRTALVVTSGWVEVRLEVDLPAAGRRIL